MIKKISWCNHPIFGNLELDFSKTNRDAHNLVLLAGINGIGKTQILNELSHQINLSENNRTSNKYYLNNMEFVSNRDESDSELVTYTLESSQEPNEAPEYWYQPVDGPNIVDFSKYSNVFLTDNTVSAENSKLNQNFNNIEKSILEFNDIDNQFIVNEIKKNTGLTWTNLQPITIIYKLMSAVEDFFEGTIKFDKIDNKKVMFKKIGIDHAISINELSSGEKSIILKAIFLLSEKIGKHEDVADYDIKKAFDGGYILIDEPEANLHPQWQNKLLKFYKKLFISTDGILKVQIFIATHSEYLVKNAIDDKDLVLIINKDTYGNYSSKRSQDIKLLLNHTSAEINYLIFNVNKLEYHIALYSFLQNHYGTTNSVAETDRKIEEEHNHGLTIPLRYSGLTSSNQYHTLCTLIRNKIDHPDSIYLYTEDELEESIECMRNIIIHLS